MPDGVTTDLLSDFTRNNVDWLRRTTARRPSLSSEEWAELAIVCEILADLAKKHRALVHTAVDRGIEAGTLKGRLEWRLTFLSDNIQAMTELQQLGADSANVRAALERIRNAKAEIEAVHADLAALLTLAEADPPPVPEDILAAAEAGPFIRLDEFRKRR
ncbi:MAG: hypothetical protein ACYC3I_00120 [Gemmataceae bacterium]